MALQINTNILSLNAQRNLSTSQSALAQSLERLSSGLRINSAKDDAAGLAISERFSTQIRGLNQAVRNANDGISLAQTGEGGLQEIQNNLQRIRELAVQSVNATNSASDRAALNQEVQQRLAEIDRVANQTSFNGQKILDGTFGNALFQVGANVGETIGVNLNTSMRQSEIGAVATATADLSGVGTAGSAAIPTDSIVSGTYTQAASTEATDAFQFLIDGAVASDRLVGDASAANLQTDIAAFVASSGGAYTLSGTVADGDLVISKADGTDLTLATRFSDAVGSANAAAGTTSNGTFGAGFIDTFTNGTEEVPATGTPVVLAEGDLQIQIGQSEVLSVAAGTYETAQSLVDAINTALGNNAQASLDDGNLSVVAGDTITIANDAQSVFTAAEFTASGSLETVTVSTVAAANDAIQRVDSALTSVSDLRSTFGAIQNRFESTIANLSTTVENLSASRSRIRDADFAAETAELTRAQILQQAGISILAQANASPQSALALLQ